MRGFMHEHLFQETVADGQSRARILRMNQNASLVGIAPEEPLPRIDLHLAHVLKQYHRQPPDCRREHVDLRSGRLFAAELRIELPLHSPLAEPHVEQIGIHRDPFVDPSVEDLPSPPAGIRDAAEGGRIVGAEDFRGYPYSASERWDPGVGQLDIHRGIPAHPDFDGPQPVAGRWRDADLDISPRYAREPVAPERIGGRRRRPVFQPHRGAGDCQPHLASVGHRAGQRERPGHRPGLAAGYGGQGGDGHRHSVNRGCHSVNSSFHSVYYGCHRRSTILTVRARPPG